MEEIRGIMGRVTGSAITSEPMDQEQQQKLLAEDYNKIQGRLNEEDGYNCPVCLNKGDIWSAEEYRPGWWTHRSRECKCMEVRRSINRMKKSGLKDVISAYTFDKYEATEDWQRTLKAAAMEYAANPEGWFFIGGQSGAGKSMLCTAICRKFLLAGRGVVYMTWLDDIANLKAVANDAEKRQPMIDRYKKADVLYIDDLFKPAQKEDGTKLMPTGADIKTAFEIINYRYINHLLTIVSSEWTEDGLLDIDEATGGRIFEHSGANGFSISPDRTKNYRLRKTVKL